jgi:chromosomal replication initiation ATPase DnaA
MKYRRPTHRPAGVKHYTFEMHHFEVMLEMIKQQFDPGDQVIEGKRRYRQQVEYRQIIIYFACMIDDMPYTRIAKYCNYRNHSSVIHAAHKIEILTIIYPDYHAKIKALYEAIVNECKNSQQPEVIYTYTYKHNESNTRIYPA